MLRYENLAKSFGGRSVFEGISGTFDTGVYALQGRNGAGKSTLLSVLAGALPADAGEVWIGDEHLTRSPLQARALLSYVPDESPIYPFITGRDYLRFVASVKKVPISPSIMEFSEALGLSQCMEIRFGSMSLGTQKKFMLCAAWIGGPQVLLLDEPSNGLDREARAFLGEQLRGLGQRATILLSSHDAEFVASSGAVVVTMERILESNHTEVNHR